MDFPQLVTEAEAADLLSLPVEIIALWAREGKLLAAARTEGGQLLFYRWRVERDGAALATFSPIRTPHRGKGNSRTQSPMLACGCRLVPPPGRLCRTGAGLLASASLAEGLVIAAPGDALFARLAGLCRDVLSRHLAGPLAQQPATPAAPPMLPEVTDAIARLEGREKHNDRAPAEGAAAESTPPLSRVAS